mgnify:CR=1 FL=1
MKANEYFSRGFNCSESVLLAAGDRLKTGSRLIPRIATGFGAGMASGSVCGAATGALMALSIKFGRDSGGEGSSLAYEKSRRFLKRFKEELGSTQCRELKGTHCVDCHKCVETAETILNDLLEE